MQATGGGVWAEWANGSGVGGAPRGSRGFTTASGFQWDTGGSGSMGAPSLSRSVLTLQTPAGGAMTQCCPFRRSCPGPSAVLNPAAQGPGDARHSPGRCLLMISVVSIARVMDEWTILLNFNPKLASRSPVSSACSRP